MKTLVVAVAGLVAFASAAVTVSDTAGLVDALANTTDDEILLADGTYDVSATLTVGKALTLRSASGDRAKVVLNGGGSVLVMKVTKVATVRDLTVSNGLNAVDAAGGGICVSAQNVTLSNLCVTCCANRSANNKESTIYGGGVYSTQSGLRIFDCLFTRCVASNPSSNSNGGAHGGGLYSSGANTLVCGTTFRSCRAATLSSDSVGGGAYVTGSGVRLENAVFEDNEVTNTAGTSDWKITRGGGLFLSGGAVASNLLLRANICRGRGAGAYLDGSATAIYDSTFTNNAIVGSFNGNTAGCGGGASANNGALFERCLFACNRSSQNGSGFGTDSGRGAMTGGFTLRKCVFENNTGNPVQLYCNKGVLDHCVIRNNSGDAIRFVNGGNESPIASFNLICDTIIENNAGRPIYSSSTDFKSSWSNDVRNCLFRNNTTTGSDILNLRLYTVKANAPKIGYVFRFENNTVVGNRAGNGTTLATYLFPHPEDVQQRYCRTRPVEVRNCVFADNAGVSADIENYPQEQTNCWNTCFQRSANLLKDEAGNYTNDCLVVTDIAGVKFRDYANGDYTLRTSSPLRNKGRTLDWMATANDLGAGGHYQVAYHTADRGVSIDFGKCRPRIVGDKSDIGAFEYAPTGMLLLVK